eukprot:m.173147 g.173147  ORF g.173147 m.173147 type:complete len:439 (+) comp15384_c0_seq2:214-1530(+)
MEETQGLVQDRDLESSRPRSGSDTYKFIFFIVVLLLGVGGVMIGLFATTSGASGDNPTDDHMMHRVFLDEPTVGKEVHCIDGSPAAFYILLNESNTNWIIWLQGGGICADLNDCKDRARSGLGSSTGYGETRTPGEAMFNDPMYKGWNKVWVPYCSGDVWAGTVEGKLNPFPEDDPDDWTGYFEGHSIVESTLEVLHTNFSYTQASNVILTGCSAGGMGTFLNCDYVASVTATGARFACRPEAGWFGVGFHSYEEFIHNKTDPDLRPPSSNWTNYIEPWSGKSPEGQACMADVLANKTNIDYCTVRKMDVASCCGTPPILYKYIESDVFVSQNSADSYQVYVQGAAPQEDTENVTNYVLYVQNAIYNTLRDQVVLGKKNRTDGIFSPACLDHCMPWEGQTIYTRTHAEAFNDWFFKGAPSLFLDASKDATHIRDCEGS